MNWRKRPDVTSYLSRRAGAGVPGSGSERQQLSCVCVASVVSPTPQVTRPAVSVIFVSASTRTALHDRPVTHLRSEPQKSVQSVSALHAFFSTHRFGAVPPQSMSVSSPFAIPSVGEGGLHTFVVALQIARSQSLVCAQILPVPHFFDVVGPPQSVSVSSPFFRPSPSVTPPHMLVVGSQRTLSQSPSTLQPLPVLHFGATGAAAIRSSLFAVLDRIGRRRDLADVPDAHVALAVRCDRARLEIGTRARSRAAAVDVRLGSVLLSVARGRGEALAVGRVAEAGRAIRPRLAARPAVHRRRVRRDPIAARARRDDRQEPDAETEEGRRTAHLPIVRNYSVNGRIPPCNGGRSHGGKVRGCGEKSGQGYAQRKPCLPYLSMSP